jgi:AcrR family transcriptional regulator
MMTTLETRQEGTAMVVRSQSSYSRILDAASRVFDEKGYHGSTVQDIADAAQLTKGGLYHHLTSKEEALYGIQERILNAGLTDLLAISQDVDSPVETRIRGAVEAIAAQHDTYTPDLRVALRDFGSLGPEYRKKIVDLRDQLEDAVEGLLAEGISAGVVIDESPDLLAKYLFGALNWMCMWYRPSGELSAQAIGAAFAGVALQGILVPSGSRDS